ncbi:MAG: T9SS type A sorting domain-containing protein [Flavobacteriales bacterium]
MKKILLASILFSLISFSSNASHYLGNDLRFEQIGPNQFVLVLRLATVSTLPPSNQVGCSIYVQNTNALATSASMQLDSSNSATVTIGSNTYGFNIGYYSDTVILPNDTNGYYGVGYHCCRSNIINHALAGMLYTCDIPNPALLGGNSNPRFVDYPDSLVFFIGINRNLDFSASDPDGDSLVYSLINPYESTSNGTKPFSLLTFNAAFNLSNILGPGGSLTINPATGILSGTAVQLGNYAIAVKCEEFRNGVLIGEVVRDIVIPAINAPIPTTSLGENMINIEASIYPNPSSGNFAILLNGADFSVSQLEIFDITGKQVMSSSLTSNKIEINTENWEKGLYFARISTGDKLITKKVIIQ